MTKVRREDIVKQVVERVFGRFPLPADHLSHVASAIVSDYEIRLPERGETSALALKNPKTAALCFDRLWSSSPSIPKDIAFHVGTPFETVYVALMSSLLAFAVASDDPALTHMVKELRTDWDDEFGKLADVPVETFEQLRGALARQLCASIRLGGVAGVLPLYDSQTMRAEEYRAGDAATLVAVLENVEVVHESQLSWEQVAQFREDYEARVAFRRMLHWLDAEMVGKPVSFIEDAVALRMHDYDKAMKRHGVQMKVGTLAALLDSNFVTAAATAGGAATIFAGGFAGVATVLGFGTAKVALHIAREWSNRDEAERNAAGEIAFVIEARDLSD